MADWSVMDRDWFYNQFDPYQFPCNQYLLENLEEVPLCQQPASALPSGLPPPVMLPPTLPSPALMPPPGRQFLSPPSNPSPMMFHEEPTTSRGLQYAAPQQAPMPKRDNPRETRNKAEKQRRDKMNQSIYQLTKIVPPVVGANRKIDKTGVLRLTAHYLRAHQYVFGDSIAENEQQFSDASSRALLTLLNGFLLATTYRGLIVVISENMQQYLGYSVVDLLGQNIMTIIHEDDRELMRDQLMPKKHLLGPNGELLVPDDPEAKKLLKDSLAAEKRRFIIRFKKLGQRSQPVQYVTCHVEGTFRKSDRACSGYNRCCQIVRRARARGDNPCSSGNDVVFIGIVRLTTATFINESNLEYYRMEYRTRHSIDGQIIQSEHRMSLVTGYMAHEVKGVNAMNFMHRDDVRWVVIALREMYDQNRLIGESCYRLMAKSGQFIYMKTRGKLEVDTTTRAVTSFVCTNTVVDETEGKHLIKQMKRKYRLIVNNNQDPLSENEETEETGEQNSAVEDPRQLEKVILHLVTNLPSPPSDNQGESPEQNVPASRLAIIPPRKERIVSAIEKIYSIIKTLKQTEEPSTEVMAYDKQTAGRSSQLPHELNRKSVLNKQSPEKVSKLPTFSDVYQRRHTEMSIQELDPIGVANPFRASSTRPASTITGALSAPTSYYSGMSTATSLPMSLLNNNLPPDFPSTMIKYHLLMAPVGPTVTPVTEASIAMPGPSSGTKRTMQYTDLDVVTKKKSTETLVKAAVQGNYEDTSLDPAFIDDALNSFPEIETAMRSLEQTIDPFPNLLISQEVEDILHQIEETPPTNNADG